MEKMELIPSTVKTAQIKLMVVTAMTSWMAEDKTTEFGEEMETIQFMVKTVMTDSLVTSVMIPFMVKTAMTNSLVAAVMIPFMVVKEMTTFMVAQETTLSLLAMAKMILLTLWVTTRSTVMVEKMITNWESVRTPST
jgi:hypothetical protein